MYVFVFKEQDIFDHCFARPEKNTPWKSTPRPAGYPFIFIVVFESVWLMSRKRDDICQKRALIIGIQMTGLRHLGRGC